MTKCCSVFLSCTKFCAGTLNSKATTTLQQQYNQSDMNRHTHPDIQPVVPVELFLQQVQACVQLAALLAAQVVQRRVEGWGWGQAAAGNLLVLSSPPTLPPETKDVGHTRECTCAQGQKKLMCVFIFFIENKLLWYLDNFHCGINKVHLSIYIVLYIFSYIFPLAYLTGHYMCFQSWGPRHPQSSR